MLKQTTIEDIQNLCNSEPQTILSIADRLKIDIKQLRNFLTTQKAKTLFFLQKVTGLIWVRTNPLNFLHSGLDLIRNKQTNGETRKSNERLYKDLTGVRRAGPERMEAILKLNRINKFGQYNKEEKKFEYSNTVKAEIDELYHGYIERVQQEKIILTRTKDNNPVFSQDIKISYKTRYTSKTRQDENIDKFRAIWDYASSKHLKGVFLTLTANPYRGTLWEINQQTRAAWKQFKDLLDSLLPANAEWIKVAEFQEAGRLHFHIVIFGINWLTHKNVIQYAWRKYGGGEILDIHTIRQDPKGGWIWARSPAQDAAGKKPKGLLSDYLQKSMSYESGSMYWATGLQVWTASKSLTKILSKDKPLQSPTKRFTLKGVLSALTGFRPSHRKDSISLFSPKLQEDEKQKNEPQKQIIQEKLSLQFSKASEITKAYLKSSRGA